MGRVPSDIEIGEAFSQEEIETAFDTGFGYRISGINPRRDKKDNRYILVFANEDGPYSDSVTQGSFEYIGEGLSGDQDEDSPGNSALIDARSSDIPVHFFYKRAPDQDWEYQGLVDVVEYEFRESDGREVLVFTLEHKGMDDDIHVSEPDSPKADEDDEADPPETVDGLLNTLSREQLQEFLAEECERSPETRDRLFARFGDTPA